MSILSILSYRIVYYVPEMMSYEREEAFGRPKVTTVDCPAYIVRAYYMGAN